MFLEYALLLMISSDGLDVSIGTDKGLCCLAGGCLVTSQTECLVGFDVFPRIAIKKHKSVVQKSFFHSLKFIFVTVVF